MPATLIDGKELARSLREQLALEARQLSQESGVIPGLAVVLVGDDPASEVYVRNKEKACQEAGLYSEIHRFPSSASEAEVVGRIRELNANPAVHGVLVQWPVPQQIDYARVIAALDPRKDVDGFHAINMGRLAKGEEGLVPCTPRGVIHMLEKFGFDLVGKEAVVVGRSNIVGKPMALLLLHRHATVTVCHSRTRDLGEVTRRADVLVVAVGSPRLIRGTMIKPGAVVIDVGVNRLDGKLVGDVDFDEARQVAGAISPVPGGVGPMTIAMLLANTIEAARTFSSLSGLEQSTRR